MTLRQEEWVLTVAQLNEYVRKTLAADPMLKRVRLQGEISNFKRHTSGHLYFSLKDDQARIACVMFRQHAMGLSIRPQEGMRVVLTGQVALYPRDGQYQFYAEHMRADGVGDLFVRFEALKRQLEAEGLFDTARKQPLPLFPRTVGIITSPTGAAVRDIIRVATQRHPGVHLLLYPARVQGEGAAQEIVAGLHALTAMETVDVIICGRGGGSMEDLWAFNEEVVARAIAASPVPVISAVGHETDFTIADFVADLRAPTPTAAAVAAVPDLGQLRADVSAFKDRMDGALAWRMTALERQLKHLGRALEAYSPIRSLEAQARHLGLLSRSLGQALARSLYQREQRLARLGAQLRALGPEQVLSRGYAYVTDGSGALLPAAHKASPGQQVAITWKDGKATAHIDQVNLQEAVHADK